MVLNPLEKRYLLNLQIKILVKQTISIIGSIFHKPSSYYWPDRSECGVVPLEQFPLFCCRSGVGKHFIKLGEQEDQVIYNDYLCCARSFIHKEFKLRKRSRGHTDSELPSNLCLFQLL